MANTKGQHLGSQSKKKMRSIIICTKILRISFMLLKENLFLCESRMTLFCFSFPLSLPSVRFSGLLTTSTLSSFNKCYLIILMERNAEQAKAIIENMASMFNHLPIFTIIILENGEKYLRENSANSPLVFINSKKVKRKIQQLHEIVQTIFRRHLPSGVQRRQKLRSFLGNI